MSSVNPYASSPGDQPAARTSRVAIASLVCGLISFIMCPLTGIPAIVLAIIALSKIGKSRGMLLGRGLAIAGLITGSLATLATLAVVGILLPALNAAREKGIELVSLSNMRNIASAIILNQQKARHFPGNIVDKNGIALLSWRVRILPELGHDALYRQFHLNEPWDSEHNRGLVSLMPPFFENPAYPDEGKTQYLVPVGEGTIFEAMMPKKLPQGDRVDRPVSADDVARADGIGTTIMLVEATPDRAVIWTKPDDLNCRRDDPGAGLSHRSGEILVAYVDGRVMGLSAKVQPSTLRKLFSFDGGRRFHEPPLTEDELHP